MPSECSLSSSELSDSRGRKRKRNSPEEAERSDYSGSDIRRSRRSSIRRQQRVLYSEALTKQLEIERAVAPVVRHPDASPWDQERPEKLCFHALCLRRPQKTGQRLSSESPNRIECSTVFPPIDKVFVEEATSTTRRSDRPRRLGAAMKRVDDETRHQVAEARLLALERDQASGAVDTFDAADDVWVPSDSSDDDTVAANSYKRRRSRKTEALEQSVIGTKRERKTLEMILVEDRAETEKTPNLVNTFEGCEVGESRFPSVKICSVCLYLAKYQCVRCGMLYCSKRCHDIHRETKCIKFAE